MTETISKARIGDSIEDGSVFAGFSPDTGKKLYTTPEDAPHTCNFDGAQEYAAWLNRQTAHGHNDWRVPTKGELNLLFVNRQPIGGFNVRGQYPGGWYWSSSHRDEDGVWGQRFSDGQQNCNFMGIDSSLRCVRG